MSEVYLTCNHFHKAESVLQKWLLFGRNVCGARPHSGRMIEQKLPVIHVDNSRK